jgi:hypothetical protein
MSKKIHLKPLKKIGGILAKHETQMLTLNYVQLFLSWLTLALPDTSPGTRI